MSKSLNRLEITDDGIEYSGKTGPRNLVTIAVTIAKSLNISLDNLEVIDGKDLENGVFEFEYDNESCTFKTAMDMKQSEVFVKAALLTADMLMQMEEKSRT